MTKEQYFRKMASLLMQVKAVVDDYEEGCEYLRMSIMGNHISFSNDPNKKDAYGFWFNAGQDIENGAVVSNSGRYSWIADEEF